MLKWYSTLLNIKRRRNIMKIFPKLKKIKKPFGKKPGPKSRDPFRKKPGPKPKRPLTG